MRFSEEKNIIKNNEENLFNKVIIKIMWIESYTKYIEGILEAFELGKDFYNDKKGFVFYQKIFDTINDMENPIKYITEKKRAEHMKEVNDAFIYF